MKLFKWMKDGGPESRVFGFFLVEIKKLFSIVLLRFDNGSRDAFHSHAFNSISWLIRGELLEFRILSWDKIKQVKITKYLPSFNLIITTRDNLHRVESYGITWVLTFRGPWSNTWQEFLPETEEIITLTNGRKIVN